MPRRFQFSLIRAEIAVAILCAALALIHQAWVIRHWRFEQGITAVAIAGVLCAAAVGTMAAKVRWCVAASIVAIIPCVIYVWLEMAIRYAEGKQ